MTNNDGIKDMTAQQFIEYWDFVKYAFDEAAGEYLFDPLQNDVFNQDVYDWNSSQLPNYDCYQRCVYIARKHKIPWTDAMYDYREMLLHDPGIHTKELTKQQEKMRAESIPMGISYIESRLEMKSEDRHNIAVRLLHDFRHGSVSELNRKRIIKKDITAVDGFIKIAVAIGYGLNLERRDIGLDSMNDLNRDYKKHLNRYSDLYEKNGERKPKPDES